jgi:uncharacterized protein DUF1707
MAGPGDEMAAGAGGRSHLRASHADREQVIGMLKAAFVQGRLAKDELDQRVGQTFAARTYAELAAITADLPPGLITAPPRKPARARAHPPVGKAILVRTAMFIPPAMLIAVLLTGSDPLGNIFLLIAPWYLIAWIVAGMQLVASWHDNRSRGQLPPRPAQGGQSLEGKQDGQPGDDWALCQARGDARARRLPGAWRHPAHLVVTAGAPGPAKYRHGPGGRGKPGTAAGW